MIKDEERGMFPVRMKGSSHRQRGLITASVCVLMCVFLCVCERELFSIPVESRGDRAPHASLHASHLQVPRPNLSSTPVYFLLFFRHFAPFFPLVVCFFSAVVFVVVDSDLWYMSTVIMHLFPWLHYTYFCGYITPISIVTLYIFPWLHYTYFHEYIAPISMGTLHPFPWIHYTCFHGYITPMCMVIMHIFPI